LPVCLLLFCNFISGHWCPVLLLPLVAANLLHNQAVRWGIDRLACKPFKVVSLSMFISLDHFKILEDLLSDHSYHARFMFFLTTVQILWLDASTCLLFSPKFNEFLAWKWKVKNKSLLREVYAQLEIISSR